MAYLRGFNFCIGSVFIDLGMVFTFIKKAECNGQIPFGPIRNGTDEPLLLMPSCNADIITDPGMQYP
jgi:hypothetical protein